MQIHNRQYVQMLSPEVAARLHELYYRTHFQYVGCLLTDDDSGPKGLEPPIIPYAPFVRSRVYTGTAETGSYNHHTQIAKLNGRYYLAFSNGLRDEVAGEQRVMVATSYDAVNWSTPICLAGGEKNTNVSFTCAGIYCDSDSVYILTRCDDTIPDPAWIGGRRVIPESARLGLYACRDGMTWAQVHGYREELRCLYEGPRLTAEGRAMCSCALSVDRPCMLLWPGSDISTEPQVVDIELPEGASFEYGEASWYQIADGRILAFWRDEMASCRLYVNWSDDGGATFSTPVLSDIPDSMGRVYAGRLSDGRYYLCANAFPSPLNRRHLMLLLSENGLIFDRVYTLIDDPTAQRRKGLLKVDGFQYPCCLAEDGRLIVAYSGNKEDIECGVVDTRAL